MNKRLKIGIIIGFIITLFAGGFLQAYLFRDSKSLSILQPEPFRQIQLGKSDSKHVEQINWYKILINTTKSDIAEINNIETIFFNSPTITNVHVATDKPDLYIQINGFDGGAMIGYMDAKVWFTPEGAIIGVREGENWDTIQYKSTNTSTTDYLKSLLVREG